MAGNTEGHKSSEVRSKDRSTPSKSSYRIARFGQLNTGALLFVAF